ncbi:zinc transporter 2 [Platysternon megacephalum]|uniref:Zinc transporter 2 n=1 Tax=Platysternon megacephalum TaxID=55544 RepID=A0A4D9EVH7_9SAUR|nr:zinc transporter 2 [Platysternon megacephalum]
MDKLVSEERVRDTPLLLCREQKAVGTSEISLSFLDGGNGFFLFEVNMELRRASTQVNYHLQGIVIIGLTPQCIQLEHFPWVRLVLASQNSIEQSSPRITSKSYD